MAEYIEREALHQEFDCMSVYVNDELYLRLLDVGEFLCSIPNADVAPVVHGRWLKTEEPLVWEEISCIECSACHESWMADRDYGLEFADYWKYCPNCGARMDGE